MTPTATLILGASQRLPELDSESIDLVITSPPYWQLKDYGPAQQIGWQQSLDAYHDALEEVWRECIRVLAPGCRMCINIGDQFARKEVYGRYKVVPLHSEIMRRVEGLGLDFMGSIIWRKVTNCSSSGGGALMGSYPHPRNGIVKFDYEHILLFKKLGKAPTRSKEEKAAAALSLEDWKTYFNGHWEFPGARAKTHLAPFPLELPRRLIRMFSFPGETVLDPFVGSGTTIQAAAELERHSVGVDLDPESEDHIRARLGEGDGALPFSSTPLKVLRRDEEVASNPQPVPSDTPFFGSVVSKADRAKTQHKGVRDRLKTVLGPHQFETKGGRTVTLLGVEPNPKCARLAQARLESLLEGKSFLLTDAGRNPVNEELRELEAYVHRLDKTFVNSRLIREGLVVAAREGVPHRHREKFIREELAQAEAE